MSTTQNVWLRFTPRDGEQPGIIEYFSSASCKEPWNPPPVGWAKETHYIFHRVDSPNSFTFFGVSFWGRSSDGSASKVARTFTQGQSGKATFDNSPYVTVRGVEPDRLRFSLNNSFNPLGGSVSLQVTLCPSGEALERLFTSKDPEIKMDKEPP